MAIFKMVWENNLISNNMFPEPSLPNISQPTLKIALPCISLFDKLPSKVRSVHDRIKLKIFNL